VFSKKFKEVESQMHLNKKDLLERIGGAKKSKAMALHQAQLLNKYDQDDKNKRFIVFKYIPEDELAEPDSAYNSKVKPVNKPSN